MATKNNLFSKARFTFVGTITYNKKDNAPVSDNPLKEGSKWNRKRLNIGVMDEAKNVGYLTMDYIYDTIRCRYTNKYISLVINMGISPSNKHNK